MELFTKFIFRKDVQRYITLIIILISLYILRDQINIILFTIIFSYLAITNSNRLHKRTKIPFSFCVLVIYASLISLLSFSLHFVVPILINQMSTIPKQIDWLLKSYPDITKMIIHFDVLNEINKNSVFILSSGWIALTKTSNIIIQISLSTALSFVLSLTWQSLKQFSEKFKKSLYPNFFENLYQLIGPFIAILGGMIEVQLQISCINAILMILGMCLLQLPNILALGLIVFILGFIPIIGVMLSLIPLSIAALASQGMSGFINLLILICIIHLIESYVLHPRLMSAKMDLPVFVVFASLIIMEHLIGGWGLIIGVPIVAYILYLFGIQQSDLTKQFKLEN